MRKKYRKAVKYAMESEQALRSQIQEYQYSVHAISSAESSIDNAKKYIKDVSSAEDLLWQAKSSFEEKDFKTALDYAGRCESEMRRLLEESCPHLSLILLTHDKLKADTWNRLEFHIKNSGNTRANNIKLAFPEPFEIKSYEESLHLNADEEKKIEIGVKPCGAGNLPIDVTIACERAFDGKQFMFGTVQWLNIEREVSMSPAEAKEEIEKLKHEMEELKSKYKSGEVTYAEVKAIQDKAKIVESAVRDTEDKVSLKELKELMLSMAVLRPQVTTKEYFEGGKTDISGVVQRSTIGTERKEKVFKTCPYCGEQLNLPETPKFCSYCGKRLQ